MRYGWLLALTVAVTMSGCITKREWEPIPAQFRTASSVYFVENHGGDKRNLDGMIAKKLVSHGVQATSSVAGDRPSENVDVLVTYEDRWHWDMGTYLLQFEMFLREPETKALIARGLSYQSSLAREDPQDIISAMVDGMWKKGEEEDSTSVAPES